MVKNEGIRAQIAINMLRNETVSHIADVCAFIRKWPC